MNRAEAWDLVASVTGDWVEDPSSDVVFAGEHEGRWAVRMAQQVRDFTTVWFEVGDRTVGYESFVLPRPPLRQAEIHRQLLARNLRLWRAHFSIDKNGDIVLTGRLSLTELRAEVLDEVLGAVYEAVEVSFRSLLRLGFTGRPAVGDAGV